jgi:hypothetical protein
VAGAKFIAPGAGNNQVVVVLSAENDHNLEVAPWMRRL